MIAWTSPARTLRSSPRRISRSPTFAWRFLISSMMDFLPAPRIGNPYQKVNVCNRWAKSNLRAMLRGRAAGACFRARYHVSRLRFKISMSLDGFVAGPRQSVDNPLGVGGTRLHEWAFALAVFRAEHGLEGGEVNASTKVVEESLANIGATVMGRNMFGGHPGPWDARKPWAGWWGVNPPYHHPVFVLTHHARAPLELER